ADHVALFEPRAGFLEPEKAIAAFVETALRSGHAEIHAHEPVEQWHADGARAVVKTSRGEYRSEKIIFCGGPWTDQLLRDLGVPLTVTRQVLGWVWPLEPEIFEIGRLPVWAIDQPDRSEEHTSELQSPYDLV